MPMFKALKACAEATVIKPDMKKYAAVGREVRAMMRNLTPLVEPLSIEGAELVARYGKMGRLTSLRPARLSRGSSSAALGRPRARLRRRWTPCGKSSEATPSSRAEASAPGLSGRDPQRWSRSTGQIISGSARPSVRDSHRPGTGHTESGNPLAAASVNSL